MESFSLTDWLIVSGRIPNTNVNRRVTILASMMRVMVWFIWVVHGHVWFVSFRYYIMDSLTLKWNDLHVVYGGGGL
jgi:hypothetical protein